MQLPYLGIEIGGTKLQLVLGDDHGTIIRRWRGQVDPAEGANGILRQIESVITEARQSTGLQAVGVGFGGPVDWNTGAICCSHHVEGWSGVHLGAWLHSIAAAPVRIDNDANVAALGEACHGAGRGFNPVFYVTLGSGVGGGLVVDQRIYHGAIPGEAEIGHVRLDRTGAILESRCSGWAVDKKIRALTRAHPESLLANLTAQETRAEAKFLAPALEKGDALAHRILDETAQDLAFGLSHVTHLLHPEIIVLGGGLSLLGEPLRAAVSSALPNFIMDAFQPGPRVILAELSEDAVPVGALVLARTLMIHTDQTVG